MHATFYKSKCSEQTWQKNSHDNNLMIVQHIFTKLNKTFTLKIFLFECYKYNDYDCLKSYNVLKNDCKKKIYYKITNIYVYI